MSTRSYRKRSLAPSATVLALSMAIGMSTILVTDRPGGH